MIIHSRRISIIYNQFPLSRYKNVANNYYQRELYPLNNHIIKKNISNNIIINQTKTYRLRSIAVIPRAITTRYVSKSSKILAQTEIMKGEGDQGLNLYYEDILKAQKDETVLIVDVREDAEIKETGKLPGSIHIPKAQTANVLTNLSEKEFFEKFNKPKPTKDTKIIFSCRLGQRSATVQEEMLKLGYRRSYNYTGGWQDWENQNKRTPKA